MAFLLTSQTIRRQVKGFTLIELIIVIAIIGILAVLGFGAYMLGIERARIARAQGDLDKIKKAVLQLELDTNLDPGVNSTTCSTAMEFNLGAANTGLEEGDGAGFSGWKGPYTDDVPNADPWGNAYVMKRPYTCSTAIKGCGSYSGTVRVLFSKGEDGSSGSVPNDTTDDIVTVLCK